MKAGSRLGTCLLMVVDETQCMVSATRNLEEFFARESCGFCTPCRDGLPCVSVQYTRILNIQTGSENERTQRSKR